MILAFYFYLVYEIFLYELSPKTSFLYLINKKMTMLLTLKKV